MNLYAPKSNFQGFYKKSCPKFILVRKIHVNQIFEKWNCSKEKSKFFIKKIIRNSFYYGKSILIRYLKNEIVRKKKVSFYLKNCSKFILLWNIHINHIFEK